MATIVNNEWSSSGETSTQKNGYLRTAKQRATFNKYNKKTRKYENKVNKLVKKGFKNPYQKQLNDITKRIGNSKFEYDLNKDAIYEQYKNQYQQQGEVASQQAQAEATALSGGFANSYAQTAGQQAYNSYITQLQSIVPQLYQQARSDYETNLANLYNQANLYSGLSEQAFNKWNANLQQASANRDYYYNKANNYKNSTQYQKNTSNSWSKGGSTTKKGK